MPFDIYSTRTMLKAVNQTLPVQTFFMETFFPGVITVPTEHIDTDVKKGKRRMAPFVSPRKGGKVIERDGFETETIKVPKIAPERMITNEDVNTRGMGESLYSDKTPAEREQSLLAQDLMELDDSVTRREEWMCRELLLSGKILIKGEGVEKEVNFNFTNKETLIGGARWSESTSDPIADLKRWRLDIIKKTGKGPNIAVFASDVVDAYISNPKVQKLMDLQRVNVGTIEPSIKNEAVTYEINTSEARIDWTAKGHQRILQNVINLISTWRYEVGFDRTKGMDTALLDKPIKEAINLYIAEVYRIVEEHEPRALVKEVKPLKEQNGEIQFKVVVEIV